MHIIIHTPPIHIIIHTHIHITTLITIPIAVIGGETNNPDDEQWDELKNLTNTNASNHFTCSARLYPCSKQP